MDKQNIWIFITKENKEKKLRFRFGLYKMDVKVSGKKSRVKAPDGVHASNPFLHPVYNSPVGWIISSLTTK